MPYLHEVNLANRDLYFEKVVRHARHGFIADNSGWTGDGSAGSAVTKQIFILKIRLHEEVHASFLVMPRV